MPRSPPMAGVLSPSDRAVGRARHGHDRRAVDRERARAARAGVAGRVALRRLRRVLPVGQRRRRGHRVGAGRAVARRVERLHRRAGRRGARVDLAPSPTQPSPVAVPPTPRERDRAGRERRAVGRRGQRHGRRRRVDHERVRRARAGVAGGSVCVACAVYVPSASAGEPSIVHVPPLRVAVRVCTGEPVAAAPAVDVHGHRALSPVALPAAPEYAGVVSFVREPSAGAVSVTPGGVVSTMNVLRRARAGVAGGVALRRLHRVGALGERRRAVDRPARAAARVRSASAPAMPVAVAPA